MNVATPIIGTIYWGAKLGGGLGALVGAMLGIGIGAGNLFGLLAVRRACLRRLAGCDQQKRLKHLRTRLLYFLIGSWMFISGLLGIFMTQQVLHLLGSNMH